MSSDWQWKAFDALTRAQAVMSDYAFTPHPRGSDGAQAAALAMASVDATLGEFAEKGEGEADDTAALVLPNAMTVYGGSRAIAHLQGLLFPPPLTDSAAVLLMRRLEAAGFNFDNSGRVVGTLKDARRLLRDVPTTDQE